MFGFRRQTSSLLVILLQAQTAHTPHSSLSATVHWYTTTACLVYLSVPFFHLSLGQRFWSVTAGSLLTVWSLCFELVLYRLNLNFNPLSSKQILHLDAFFFFYHPVLHTVRCGATAWVHRQPGKNCEVKLMWRIVCVVYWTNKSLLMPLCRRCARLFK